MRNQSGYTIIETLVALAILSTGLVGFYSVGGTSLRATSHIARVNDAILLAQSMLDQVASQQDLLESRMNGSFAGTPYKWTMSAIRLPDTVQGEGAAHLQDVTLTITWREGVKQQSIIVPTRHLGRDGA